MNILKSESLIESVFKEYSETISDIGFYQGFIKRNSELTYKEFIQIKKNRDESIIETNAVR